MALADKYMSNPRIRTYKRAHYQLVVVASLGIAIKVDSPGKAPSSKHLSELCMGAYTPEEIQSEEMCVIKTLSWRLNPPIASQMANHILALVLNLVGVGNDWGSFVERVHAVINTSVLDQSLMMLRPSTLALASILVSTDSFCDSFQRHGVVRSTLSIMNMFDFDSPCEVDSARTNLRYVKVHVRQSMSQQAQPQFQTDQKLSPRAINDSRRPNYSGVVPLADSRSTSPYQIAANGRVLVSAHGEDSNEATRRKFLLVGGLYSPKEGV